MLNVVVEPGAVVGILFVSDVYFPRVNGVSTSIQTFRPATSSSIRKTA